MLYQISIKIANLGGENLSRDLRIQAQTTAVLNYFTLLCP